MSEREIKLEDIRVGDTIRREFTFSDVAGTHTAVVACIDGGSAITAENKLLASVLWRNSTYILVDRPKPPLPTERPALIKVTKLNWKSGEWIAKLCSGQSWGVFEVAGDDDYFRAKPQLIEEWHHIEIFEVTE